MPKKYRRTIPVFFFLLALIFGITACSQPGAENKPDILFIVVDTLRADRLSCYGWKEATSPNIDRLAASGVLAEKMLCQVPQTLPSFCTILTGVHPPTHGVRSNGLFALPPRLETLPEIFKQEGYQTAAFLAGFPLDGRFGLNQGFDTYCDKMVGKMPTKGVKKLKDGSLNWLGHSMDSFENRADHMTQQAVEWLAQREDEPFFLMVHYFDPHHYYRPPPRLGKQYKHPYAGEVAFVDEQIGLLLEELKKQGLAEDTLVVFTADHGECLGKHGRFMHQEHLTDAALHVPFIARWPGRLPEGLRIEGHCRSVDIMPTLLELTEIDPPEAVEGTALTAAFQTGKTEIPICYFETFFGIFEAQNGLIRKGITQGNWKFVQSEERIIGKRGRTKGTSVKLELYDLENDPEELNNLAHELHDQLMETSTVFDQFLMDHKDKKPKVLEPDPETLDKMKALGYF